MEDLGVSIANIDRNRRSKDTNLDTVNADRAEDLGISKANADKVERAENSGTGTTDKDRGKNLGTNITDRDEIKNLSTGITNIDGVEDLGITDANRDNNLRISRQLSRQYTTSNAAYMSLLFLCKNPFLRVVFSKLETIGSFLIFWSDFSLLSYIILIKQGLFSFK